MIGAELWCSPLIGPALGLQHRRDGLQLRERWGGAAAVRGHGHHHRRGEHGGYQAGRRFGQHRNRVSSRLQKEVECRMF